VALTPNFDRIVATITAADVEKFLRSAAPEDDKQRVLNAPTDEIRKRLVGGYLIRTNQVTAERLTGKPAKARKSGVTGSKSAGTRTGKTAKAVESSE